MKNDELIGRIGAAYLRNKLSDDDEGSTARYILDCLSAEQTASIARSVSADSHLSNLTEIKLPANFVGNLGLPSNFLTNERTTYFRNANCSKPILLVANTGDDEEQSLKELEPIGRPQLLENPSEWVRIAAKNLHLTDDSKKWWTQALFGLLEVKHYTLERFANYILASSAAIEDGDPLITALGVALPELRLPRDTVYFHSLNEKTARHKTKWKNLYNHIIKRRSCYLLKQTPSQGHLTKENLRESFKNVRTSIPEKLHDIITAFIEAPSGWNNQARALAECEWETVKPLFDGLKKEKFNLGKATAEFYDERESELLTDDDHDYLDRLSKRKTTEPQDEDDDFYMNHRIELKENPSLKAKWDRFVYGKPVESDDFLVGIAMCLETLFDQDLHECKKSLEIRCDKRTKIELKKLNRDAGLFFSLRYRGLIPLFGSQVKWDVGQLFQFEKLDEEWRTAKKTFVNRSAAKAALKLKFFLELEVELLSGQTETYTKQLIWTYKPNAIPSELPGDWGRLVKHPLVRCVANLEPVSGKGHFQTIDLFDAKTLLPTYDRDRGSFVAAYKKKIDIAVTWKKKLSQSLEQSFIDQETVDKLSLLFKKFETSYAAAIKDFNTEGVCSESLLLQCDDFKNLLDSISTFAKGDRNRELLLRPLMEIGAVRIEGGNITTLIAPWHPLRLAAMANKSRQVASLIRHLMKADEVFFGDTKLFFKELKDELTHPYYPEIVLGWNKTQAEILSLTDSYLDYSLHERPVTPSHGFDDTNESPTDSAFLVLDTLKRFLALYPHEKANLSLVLYNSDSARLPQGIVEKVSELQDDEDEMRCQIVLRHRDNRKLSDLYVKIVESMDLDPDSFVASEASKDFMARLRIGIMANQAPVPNPVDGPPADLVFLQDVIARHAKLEWYPVDATPMNPVKFVPSRWSRRRPSAKDDTKSIVFLCSPVQTAECWSYIAVLTSFLKGEFNSEDGKKLLPVRQLDFTDPETAAIFNEIHNLGNWVVNYDELLERRQLQNQNVRVIRYKQLTTQGRNVLISSTAPLGLLKNMVLGRIKGLNLELSDEECSDLVERFWSDASDISGEIVLRAAKRGRNASELMGIVLSRYLIQKELGENNYFGWYFLDDYAEWLGQREEQIADIMALVPQLSEDGKMRLSVILCESKFISYDNLSKKRKESQKQLRDTVRRISDAIFGNPRRLDRDLWLSRFSDLMLSGILIPAGSDMDLAKWRRAIREGECEIYLRGYSHVFVHGPSESPDCSEFAIVSELKNSYQEVFSRSLLREIVTHYWKKTDPMPLRLENSGVNVWGNVKFAPPSKRLNISDVPRYSSNPDTVQDSDLRESKPIKQEEKTKTVVTTSESPVLKEHSVPKQNISSDWSFSCLGDFIDSHTASNSDSDEEKEWLRNTGNACKGALQQFQLRAKLLESILTPNSALLKFQGSSNLTVEQVLKRQSEFLTTHRLKIISVRAEPGIVAISIARPNRRVLNLLDVWKNWNPECVNGNNKLLIGLREEDSSPLFISPKDNSPHTLIAGSTGSGKSVLMQNIILGIACTNTVEQSRITLIDPKHGVDYFAFEGLPHLQGGVIDSQEVAISALNSLVEEMDRRYALLKENRVSNIYDLNKKPDATVHLPYLWIIHDEFAEWMMTPEYSQNVSNVVARLGVKARAAGIFLVFAAQRPDKNVMPMQLRSNLGNRLILRVDGEGTSEIALGEKGAEKLLGKGHMAVKLEGEEGIITAQVPFIAPHEIEAIVLKMCRSG